MNPSSPSRSLTWFACLALAALLADPTAAQQEDAPPEAPAVVPATPATPIVPTAGPGDPWRRVPESWITPGDERPLEMLQIDFMRELLRTESDALRLEASLVAVNPMVYPGRAQRIEGDRESLKALIGQSFVNSTDPSPISPWSISLTDRFFYGFAVAHLRREGISIPLAEEWYQSNKSFLKNSQLLERDKALAKRDEALASMERTQLLRQILVTIKKGPLSPKQRQTFLGLLQAAYPDAALPALQLGGGGGAKTSGGGGPPGAAAGTRAPSNLPRLDGVEQPFSPLSDLSSLLPDGN